MLSAAVITEICLSAGLFLLMWVVLGQGILRPYFELLQERESRTSGDEERATELESNAADVEQQIEQQLKAATLDGIKIRDKLIAEAKSEAAGILEQAGDKVQRELAAARSELETQKAQAQAEIEREADAVAQAMLERVLEGGAGRGVVH